MEAKPDSFLGRLQQEEARHRALIEEWKRLRRKKEEAKAQEREAKVAKLDAGSEKCIALVERLLAELASVESSR
jgi:hypothetical protein